MHAWRAVRFTSFLECRFGTGFLILQNTHTDQTVLLPPFSFSFSFSVSLLPSFSYCAWGIFHCERQHGLEGMEISCCVSQIEGALLWRGV
jgi:hypothetical protein